MKIALSPAKVFLLSLVILFQFGCSNDSDLLYDYVSQDPTSNPVQNPSDPDNAPTDSTDTPVVTPPDSNTDPNLPGGDSFLGELKAFPEAMGFGKYATGGRGGAIIEVTNLNDSGPGSLRSALLMTGRRTVIFKVGGVIQLESYLQIPYGSGDITIAGQTAPSPGITIKGGEFRVLASNVIIRYMRFRPGDEITGENFDALRIISTNSRKIENIIVDHCSVSWGSDENVGIGGIGTIGGGSSVSKLTVQNSIIAENLNTGYGLLLWNDANQISIVRNLFAHNTQRNIRSSTCNNSFEFVNNIIYSFKYATQPTYENEFDVIGNVYITNPDITTSLQTVRLEASTNNCPDGQISYTKGFIADNTLDGGDITISSNLNPYLSDSKVFNSGLEILRSSEVRNFILDQVGSSLYRDHVDSRIVQDVYSRSGTLKYSASSAGGYDYSTSSNSYVDEDKDGMDDNWELENGMNPNNPADRNVDANGDGYTNLESFLHALTVVN